MVEEDEELGHKKLVYILRYLYFSEMILSDTRYKWIWNRDISVNER